MRRSHSLLCAGFIALSLPALADSTGVAGGGQPVDLQQPVLGLTALIQAQGSYPSRDFSTDDAMIAEVHLFAGNFNAWGQPRAQGQLMSIAQNTALFSLLGTQYGGDGRVTFALPDLRGTHAVGTGTDLFGRAFEPGTQVGSALTTLTTQNLPAHAHGTPQGPTTATGGGLPFELYKPSLGLTAMIAVEGLYPTQDGTTGLTFLGQIRWFAGNFAPGGWLPCDGRLLPIAQNEALFTLIGTTYGGDGEVTFALPDLRGRAAVGVGQGPAVLQPVDLGQMDGQPDMTLTTRLMPAHQHAIAGGDTGPTGGSQVLDPRQPTLGITFLIATQGYFPARDTGSFQSDMATIGEVIAFAGNFAPGGFMRTNGQLLPIQQNQALFALLGTTYGGDGRTNFALPDLRARSPLGVSNELPLGTFAGTQATVLGVAGMPPHVHDYTPAAVSSSSLPSSSAMQSSSAATSGTASSTASSSQPPSSNDIVFVSSSAGASSSDVTMSSSGETPASSTETAASSVMDTASSAETTASSASVPASSTETTASSEMAAASSTETTASSAEVVASSAETMASSAVESPSSRAGASSALPASSGPNGSTSSSRGASSVMASVSSGSGAGATSSASTGGEDDDNPGCACAANVADGLPQGALLLAGVLVVRARKRKISSN